MHPPAEGAPQVTSYGRNDMEVCVPCWWTEAQIVLFARAAYPSGTADGWRIRLALNQTPDRDDCDLRPDFVHVTLDC